MSRTEEQETETAPERNAAKEQLVSAVAATWGARAAEQAVTRIRTATSDAETRAVLEEFAGSILTEAGRRFSEPVLAEVWREAANEAACSRLSAIAQPPMQKDEQLVSGVLLNPGERDVLPYNWPPGGHIEEGPAETVWAHVILHGKQESRAVWRG